MALASKDLNSEMEAIEVAVFGTKEKGPSVELSDYEKIQIKCSVLTLRLLRDIRSNQVLDMESRGVKLRDTKPKGTNENKAR